MSLIESSIQLWHPWQIKQLELLQGTALTNPYCQRFAQEYVIGTVQSGTALLQYRHSRYEVAAGALYVIEPGEAWACQSKNLTFQHLFVAPALLQCVATEIAENEKALPHFSRLNFIDTSLSAALHDLYARSTTPASRLQQQEMLLHVLAQLIRSHAEKRGEQSKPGWERPAIRRIKAYLEEHYAEDVSLKELASIANLSAFHLSRVFRQTVGLPPHAYQTQIRIARARTLLAQGFSVGYVASETGFFDQMHFTRYFKRLVGVTPGAYRKTARFY
jgi:AraC-like DNA-binding protein